MRIHLFLSFVLFSTYNFAQKKPDLPKEFIAAKHQVIDNTISIRWAPSSLDLWLCSQNSGYLIQRFELEKNEVADSTSFANAKAITASLAGKSFEKNDLRWSKFIKKDSAVKMVFDYRFNLTETEKRSKEMAFAYNYIQLSADFSLYSALAQGMFFQDSTFNKRKRYGYKISIIDCNLKFNPAFITVELSKGDDKLPVIKINGKSDNKLANISWNAAALRASYSYYNIEKSEDSLTFVQINKNPVLFLYNSNTSQKDYVYTDSLKVNHKKYFFRIFGVDVFGNKSAYSNIITVKGSGFNTLCPLIDSAYLNLKGTVKIAGHFYSKKGFDELKEVALLKKDNLIDVYLKVDNLNFENVNFSTFDDKPSLSNYYQIVLINKSNESLQCPTFFVAGIDSVPPAIPIEITGSVDDKGIVRLSWKKNEEKDFLGYRVFTKNSMNEELKEVTSNLLSTPTYTDTIEIKTLTKNIYYSIVAVDQMYNKSKYSKIIEVKRPDIIPPSAAVFKQISVSDSSINLSWINSYSTDVLNTKLFVMNNDSLNVLLLTEWKLNDSITSFVYTKGVSGSLYRFMLLVSDSTNNITHTKSQTINYKVYQVNAIKIVDFKANYEKNCIELKWEDASSLKKVFNYEVYKNKIGEKPLLYKTTHSITITDYEVAINNKYEYCVKAIYTDGTESMLSVPFKIEY